jgi:hypothetical protein
VKKQWEWRWIFLVVLDEDWQSSAVAERESVPFEFRARKKFVCARKILSARGGCVASSRSTRRFGILTIVGNLRAHARCALVPPLRGLRSC